MSNLTFHQPSLDDVFFALTGHATEAEAAEADGEGPK